MKGSMWRQFNYFYFHVPHFLNVTTSPNNEQCVWVLYYASLSSSRCSVQTNSEKPKLELVTRLKPGHEQAETFCFEAAGCKDIRRKEKFHFVIPRVSKMLIRLLTSVSNTNLKLASSRISVSTWNESLIQSEIDCFILGQSLKTTQLNANIWDKSIKCRQ